MGFFPAVPWLHFRPLVLISALADCKFPPYCTLEPARGWLLENPVPRKVRKVSPRSVRFFTLLIMLRFVHPLRALAIMCSNTQCVCLVLCFERSEGKEHLRKHSGYPRGL